MEPRATRRLPPRFFQCTRPVYIVPRAFCGRVIRRPLRRSRPLPAFHYFETPKKQISAIEVQSETVSRVPLEELCRRLDPPSCTHGGLTGDKLERVLQVCGTVFGLSGREVQRVMEGGPAALERLRGRIETILLSHSPL